MVLESTVQEVMEGTPEEEPKGGCTDDVSLNSKGYVTDTHDEVLSAPDSMRGTAIRAFHAEGVLFIDPHVDFFCKAFSDDDDLRALIQDTSFCANVVNENINFSQGKR
jgi:hypothetical protein